MNKINEELLQSWLRLSTIINNERLVSDMPFNEALVCNILYRYEKHDSEKKVTATDLCNETKMLKSQMNRTLNNMEEKNLIQRERSKIDKRQVFIKLNLKQAHLYFQQHTKIMELLDKIVDKFGEEKTFEIIKLFTMISDTLEEVIS